MNFNTLIEKVESSKEIDFGNVFEKSIELFKKTWGQGVLFVIMSIVVTMLVYIPVFLVGGVAAFSIASLGELGGLTQTENAEMYAAGASIFSVILFWVLFLLVLTVMITVISALKAGYYRVVHAEDMDKQREEVGMFMFFKWIYLKKMFALSCMSFGIALLAAGLCVLPLLYVVIPLTYISIIFAFNPELSAKEILKASFKLGNKKWLITFGLVIVSSLVAQTVGMMLCFVGVLFTASFAYLPTYFIYKDTVGFDDDDEIAQIGTTEI